MTDSPDRDRLVLLRERTVAALSPVLGARDSEMVAGVIDFVAPEAGRRRHAALILDLDRRGCDANEVDLRLWRRALDMAALALLREDDEFDAVAAAVPGLTYGRLCGAAAALRDATSPAPSERREVRPDGRTVRAAE